MAYRESSYELGAFDTYLFTKNLQGDVIGIYDVNGTKVATYNYNAWGECTVTNYTTANIGNINPFRYRGYYYDTETGFYYLNARYYDPQIKRFINADHINYLGANGDLNAYNLYAYCSDNPVVYVDQNGDFRILVWKWILKRYNKKHNQKNESENKLQKNIANKIIDNQEMVREFQYGLFPANFNACEIIAIHNALILKGRSSSFSDVLDKCHSVNGLWLFGAFGTKPDAIGKVLLSYGVEFTLVKLDQIDRPGIYIISYWVNGKITDGIHTVALEFDGKKYRSYNNGSDKDIDPRIYAQNYICGYYLK